MLEEAHDDADFGIQATRIERDFEIGHVVVGGDDDHLGVGDASGDERGVVFHVADDDGRAGGFGLGNEHAVFISFDGDDSGAGGGEFFQHADAQVTDAAEHNVISIGGGHDSHPFLLPMTFREEQQSEANDAFADDDQTDDRIKPAEQREVPGGGDGIDRLNEHGHPGGVDGVEEIVGGVLLGEFFGRDVEENRAGEQSESQQTERPAEFAQEGEDVEDARARASKGRESASGHGGKMAGGWGGVKLEQATRREGRMK